MYNIYLKNVKELVLKRKEIGPVLVSNYLSSVIKNRRIELKLTLAQTTENICSEALLSKLESLVLQKDDTRLVALVCPDFEAVDADKLTQEQLEVVMEENRKLVNAELAAYEQINEVRIYTHEFEKTPKKSIKRFLYEA